MKITFCLLQNCKLRSPLYIPGALDKSMAGRKTVELDARGKDRADTISASGVIVQLPKVQTQG
jgi:hypothetical protein